MSANDTQLIQATNLISEMAHGLAASSKVGIILIDWKFRDNLYILEMRGPGGKTASKLFEPAELALFPLEGASKLAFEAQLSRLIQYFKRK